MSDPISQLDATHDPQLLSWVDSANDHADFPIQNLPHGVFSPPSGAPRGGVAIGDKVLDLQAVLAAGLMAGASRQATEAAARDELNDFLALGPDHARALRTRLSALLSKGAAEQSALTAMLYEAAACTLHLPARIGDYTDFYAGIHHATNVGTLFRPEAPLLPNYKYIPIGYHGRASSVRESGKAFHRPSGQTRPPAGEPGAGPRFGPCRNLDYELELGIWIGRGNEAGQPVPVAEASGLIAGFCLLNDWSARDMQAWEYQPLGPFLAKSFATTISPWIVTEAAMAPFRVPQPARPAGDPAPLPYLMAEADQARGALALTLEVSIATPKMRGEGAAPHRLSSVHAEALYWTVAQLVAHHASNGCDLRPGDLLGSGTISGKEDSSWGSLLELTRQGAQPVILGNGEIRRFLEDGDEIIFRGVAQVPGARSIGFGECRAMVLPAK